MIKGSARVVPSRGLVPASELAVGDRVLTHERRFRSILHIAMKPGADIATACSIVEAPRLVADASTQIFEVGGRWVSFTTRARIYAMTIRDSEWNDAVTKSDRMSRMTAPRAVAFEAKPGVVVLGLRPEVFFGEVIFASQVDCPEYVGMEYAAADGRFYGIAVDEDASFVAERYILR